MLITHASYRQDYDTDSKARLAVFLLTCAYAGVIATLMTPILSWILILAICACVVRVGFFVGWQTNSISMRTVNLLAILAALALAWFSVSLGLLFTMVNLLIMACAFKLLRINRAQDLKQLFAALLFLTACGFIFNQSVGYAVIYGLIALLLLFALLSLNAPSLPASRAVKYILNQAGQALPIGIVLFLVLPQLSPLWQMPTSKGARTGLSEEVTPGDIAELSQSAELAFRASFEATSPKANQRYWRVMTLERFDGKSWTKSPARNQVNRQYQQLDRQLIVASTGPSWKYEVVAEPTHQPWLFSLDTPQITKQPDVPIRVGHEYQLVAQHPVLSTLTYAVESFYTVPLDQTLYSIDARINLQIPDTGNPLTQEWVADLRRQHPNDNAFVDAIRDFFITHPFRYTLRPNRLPSDPVDHFLFTHQAGFCAHYASAFAYALRLGGIPARMVTGYQGGEEQVRNVFSVYQYDAHAWVEAWFDDRGWIRFDPTAWVSPDRITYGLEQAMREEGSFLSDSPLSLARFQSIFLFNQMRLWFANVDYQWSKWVLGFDNNQQNQMLRSLFGELSVRKMSLIGVGVVFLIATLIGLYILPKIKAARADPVLNLYRNAVYVVSKKTGINRQTLPPTQYLHAVKPKMDTESFVLFEDISRFVIEDQFTPDSIKPKASLKKAQQCLKKLTKQLQKSRS